jgi:hypothetical protein
MLKAIVLGLLIAFSATGAQSQQPSPSSRKTTSKNQQIPAAQQQPTADDNRGTKDAPLIIEMTNPPSGDAIAAEIKKNRDNQAADDRRSLIFNFLLVAVGVLQAGALIFTIFVTNKAANAATLAADVAKDTLIATQRPWIFVKLQLGQRGLFFNMNEANLDLVFLLKNTGNSPAVTVGIECIPRIDVKINDRIIELEKICSSARNRTPHPQMWGYTIFPDDTLTIEITYTFANKEMLDKIVNEERGFIDPVVIGCIDYLFTFGEPIHHQSRFVYTVDYPLPQGGSRSINITEGDKASYLLRISPWLKARSFQAD